jgi:EAL domain-containing protein (putative c-di-GMP-specific phosphodiesterase class I)
MVAQAVRLSNLDIDNALKNRDFEVLFQPIFDLGNGALARVETFIRWRHPTLGVLPPGAFISFFETQGRMSELTRYVLGEALAAYRSWRGPYPPGFSINLALSDLSDESFASHFGVVMREAGFPAELVTLECPMPAVDAEVGAVSRQLQRLAQTGARLAIEVRGRANEFLNSVDPFPFAEIKTGGAAILRFARTVRGPGLSAISELIELASAKNAAITAVGVEDQASLAALKSLGFAAAQGNHLGKVGPLSQFLPSHVNEVRGHLGLDPLSMEDLAALFRTGAPSFAGAVKDALAGEAPTDAAPVEETPAEDPAPSAAAEVISDDHDKIVERLAARIARTDAARQSSGKPALSAAAKAAAIARARRRGAARQRLESKNALQDKAAQSAAAPAARDMQDRLAREFEAFTNDAAVADDAALAISPPAEEIAPAPAAPAVEASPQMTGVAAAEAVRRIIRTQMPVGQTSARFIPTLRVSGAEGVAPPPEPSAARSAPPPAAKAPAPEIAPPAEEIALAPEPGTADEAPAAAAVEDIPPTSPSTEWVEETVAIAETFAPRRLPRKRRRKARLILGVLPYSGYFWPRPVREWFADQRALREARMLDE